jgi:hypothetical protein
MAIHSANPTVQRREERLAIQARMEVMDAKLGKLLEEAAKLAPPKSPQDPRVTALAKAWADPDHHLPTSAIPSLAFDDDDEIICIGITLEDRFWSLEDIVQCGLINERGAWLWHRYSAIAMALPPVNADHLRPHWKATVAGRPSL